MSLFTDTDSGPRRHQPLYERLRPVRPSDLFGQESAFGPDSPLGRAIAQDRYFPFLLWGPPGSGKSSVAHLIASGTRQPFVKLSAVFSGIKEVREIAGEARRQWRLTGRPTLLFIDEIHRYNKSQQDALLPYVEEGSIVLFGATTENPAFEINGALLSRLEVIRLEPLTPDAMDCIAERALQTLRADGNLIDFSREALDRLIGRADGDARVMLRWIEIASALPPPSGKRWQLDDIEPLVQSAALRYDKAGEEHSDLASAFIKSLRGSDPDASLYYLARMLEGGEDPRFIARRMIVFSSEDIGLADPIALPMANAAFDALERVGLPEAAINLAHAACYLALTGKSNRSYAGFRAAQADVKEWGALPTPLALRNAPTSLHRELGYGKEYRYPHDFPEAWVDAAYLPDKIRHRVYYQPGEQGDESRLNARHRERRRGKPDSSTR